MNWKSHLLMYESEFTCRNMNLIKQTNGCLQFTSYTKQHMKMLTVQCSNQYVCRVWCMLCNILPQINSWKFSHDKFLMFLIYHFEKEKQLKITYLMIHVVSIQHGRSFNVTIKSFVRCLVLSIKIISANLIGRNSSFQMLNHKIKINIFLWGFPEKAKLRHLFTFTRFNVEKTFNE